jgi:AraC-like DNA-binding protein
MDQKKYREYPIPPVLAPFIKSIWSLESDRPIRGEPRERILPDGCIELVFHFHQPFCTHFANGEAVVQPLSFVVGQMNQFIEISPRGRIGFVAVRFHAHGAYRFLPGSLKAVATEVVDAVHVWKDWITEWAERIALASTMRSRVTIVEQMLLASLERSRPQDIVVDRCLELIQNHAGELRVARLACEIGASTRQLNRRFENAIGISPKEFSRMTRFIYALRQLRGSGCQTLTDIAVASGYFDQAHFNHEFRVFAGKTPGELLTDPNIAF